MLGLLTTNAMDWQIAYDDWDSVNLLGALGYGWASFIIASESAQVIQPIQLAGAKLGVDATPGKAFGKAAKIAEWIDKFTSKEKNIFWPLKVLRPFSANNVDGALGRVGIYKIGTDLVFRFHADRMADSGRDPTSPVVGRLFEQPAEGLPVPKQFPGLGLAGLDGTWQFSGDGTCCWNKSKF